MYFPVPETPRLSPTAVPAGPPGVPTALPHSVPTAPAAVSMPGPGRLAAGSRHPSSPVLGASPDTGSVTAGSERHKHNSLESHLRFKPFTSGFSILSLIMKLTGNMSLLWSLKGMIRVIKMWKRTQTLRARLSRRVLPGGHHPGTSSLKRNSSPNG